MSYIAVTEPQSNPFAPLTSELVKQLRDNPIAIAQGLAGAPRLYLRALEPLTAGDNIRSRNDAVVFATDNGSTATMHSFGFIQYGVIRARAEKTTADGSLRLIRARDGVETELLNTTSTAVQTVDAAVIPGDALSWRAVAPTTGTVSARNARFSTGGEDLFPGPVGIRLEGNRNAL